MNVLLVVIGFLLGGMLLLLQDILKTLRKIDERIADLTYEAYRQAPVVGTTEHP